MEDKKRRRSPNPHWAPSMADFIAEKDTTKLLQFRDSLPTKSSDAKQKKKRKVSEHHVRTGSVLGK